MSPRTKSSFKIAERSVGEDAPCYIVAEVAQAHDGSLGTAHAFIEAVAKRGVDAVKFQTHIAHAESTPGEPFRVHFSKQDASRYQYWRRMEFTEPQWLGLAEHARERNITFLSTPFSFEAVNMLDRIGMPAWKIGSGETSNVPMLQRLAKTGKPVLLSTGMSPWQEIDAAVSCVVGLGAPVAVYQCTSAYPCPPEQVGLNVLGELRERYNCPVGLSDHSGTIYPSIAAAALGAHLLEVHVTFSRESFGPDVPASVTLDELGALVSGVRFIERARNHPVDKARAAEQFSEMRRLFGKSVVAARPLAQGHRIAMDDIAFKKPGTGIPSAQVESVVGRKLKVNVSADQLLSEDDFE